MEKRGGRGGGRGFGIEKVYKNNVEICICTNICTYTFFGKDRPRHAASSPAPDSAAAARSRGSSSTRTSAA
jgi:hypothetical protein